MTNHYSYSLLWEKPVFNPGQPVPCQQHPHLFEGPPTTSSRLTADEQQAIALCHTCPIINDCQNWALQHSLSTDEMIWGGMTERQRRQYAGRKSLKPISQPCAAGHPTDEAYRQPSGKKICRMCKTARRPTTQLSPYTRSLNKDPNGDHSPHKLV